MQSDLIFNPYLHEFVCSYTNKSYSLESFKGRVGLCECCKKPAPFNKEDGTSFLEVHHLKQLADGGSDTTTNAIAVCPNCHRELHFGVNKVNIKKEVINSIERLINE